MKSLWTINPPGVGDEWMVILEKVDELRQLLLNLRCGSIVFRTDGTWKYKNNEDNFNADSCSSNLIISKEDLNEINENNVGNIIFNIMRLMDLYKWYDRISPNSFKEYLQTEKNSDVPTILLEKIKDTLDYSYTFNVCSEDINISYTFNWDSSGGNIQVIGGNSSLGYTDYTGLRMFLLWKTGYIINYELYTQFFKEIRSFQNYYYQTEPLAYEYLYTSQTEVSMLNREYREKYFNPKITSYSVDCKVKVADIVDYFNLDLKIDVTDSQLQEAYINTDDLYLQFGYYELYHCITLSDVVALILDALGINLAQKKFPLDDLLKYKDITLDLE